jgi:hypothetical protein
MPEFGQGAAVFNFGRRANVDPETMNDRNPEILKKANWALEYLIPPN